jgi:hypothetical protein
VRRGTSQGEALAVWALLAADVLAILVVYSVLDLDELYNVSHEGLAGGLSRALTQLSFPSVAGAAIPIALLALDTLPRRAWLLGGPAIALCAVIAIPGVVDQHDLDARPVNAIPALGVVLAFSLTVWATRVAGGGFAPWLRGDPLRIAVAVLVVLASLPWIAAELGFHLPGDVFMTDDLYAEPGEGPTAAVHLGHHHGWMGGLLVLSALVLSRSALADLRLRRAYSALVSLMAAYGAANLTQDFWHEQVVKRGWTSWDIPSALVPKLSVMWGLIVAATVVLYALGFGRRAEEPPTGDTWRR